MPLDYKNISTPDATSALTSAGQLFDKAISGLTNTVKQAQKFDTEANTQQVLGQLQQYQTHQDLYNALPDINIQNLTNRFGNNIDLNAVTSGFDKQLNKIKELETVDTQNFVRDILNTSALVEANNAANQRAIDKLNIDFPEYGSFINKDKFGKITFKENAPAEAYAKFREYGIAEGRQTPPTYAESLRNLEERTKKYSPEIRQLGKELLSSQFGQVNLPQTAKEHITAFNTEADNVLAGRIKTIDADERDLLTKVGKVLSPEEARSAIDQVFKYALSIAPEEDFNLKDFLIGKGEQGGNTLINTLATYLNKGIKDPATGQFYKVDIGALYSAIDVARESGLLADIIDNPSISIEPLEKQIINYAKGNSQLSRDQRSSVIRNLMEKQRAETRNTIATQKLANRDRVRREVAGYIDPNQNQLIYSSDLANALKQALPTQNNQPTTPATSGQLGAPSIQGDIPSAVSNNLVPQGTVVNNSGQQTDPTTQSSLYNFRQLLNQSTDVTNFIPTPEARRKEAEALKKELEKFNFNSLGANTKEYETASNLVKQLESLNAINSTIGGRVNVELLQKNRKKLEKDPNYISAQKVILFSELMDLAFTNRQRKVVMDVFQGKLKEDNPAVKVVLDPMKRKLQDKKKSLF